MEHPFMFFVNHKGLASFPSGKVEKMPEKMPGFYACVPGFPGPIGPCLYWEAIAICAFYYECINEYYNIIMKAYEDCISGPDDVEGCNVSNPILHLREIKKENQLFLYNFINEDWGKLEIFQYEHVDNQGETRYLEDCAEELCGRTFKEMWEEFTEKVNDLGYANTNSYD